MNEENDKIQPLHGELAKMVNGFATTVDQYRRMFEPIEQIPGVKGWCVLDIGGTCLHSGGLLGTVEVEKKYPEFVTVRLAETDRNICTQHHTFYYL